MTWTHRKDEGGELSEEKCAYECYRKSFKW